MTRKDVLRSQMAAIRARTLWLLEQVPDEFLRRRVHSFYSPIGWHFGHVGRTEENWVICEALSMDPCDEALAFIYADLPDNPKDNRVNIPDRDGTVEYLSRTRSAVLAALETTSLANESPLIVDGYAWEFALQHECQHQETIAEMLCLIHQAQGPTEIETLPWASAIMSEFLSVPGGEFLMGNDDLHVYDNEKRQHLATVAPFKMSRTAVTAYQWTEFIADDGYRRRDLWSEAGWTWKEEAGAMMPEYWVQQPHGGWSIYGPMGLRAIHPDEPAASLSFFEAEAFARWSGKRLPTEIEWEFARASNRPAFRAREAALGEFHELAARYGLEGFGPTAVNDHENGGILNLAGNIWEWTSSRFLPYDGFVPFPYEGYSHDHMKGEHFVCRGGSWATAAPILRETFRNWYVPSYRQGFLGVRLAE